jgi:Skp family chaperone for outer membrane proteins
VQKSALDTYTNSVKEVAKKQGFTIIFDKNVAPYGANDITDDVAKTAIKK